MGSNTTSRKTWRSTLMRVLSCSLLPITLLCGMLSGPAKATPPNSALTGVINGRPVALYAADSPFGSCFFFEWQLPNQTWESPFSPLGCGLTQSTLDQHGGPAGFIEWYLPDINRSIAAAFGGSAGGVNGQLNTSLTTAFKFSGAAVVPR